MAKTNQGFFADFLAVARLIPPGRVATYGDVAYAAGHPGMARQVAWALRAGYQQAPWQRVVGAGGKILLTGEFALEQRLRLQAEGAPFRGLRVDIDRCRHVFSLNENSAEKSLGEIPEGARRRSRDN